MATPKLKMPARKSMRGLPVPSPSPSRASSTSSRMTDRWASVPVYSQARRVYYTAFERTASSSLSSSAKAKGKQKEVEPDLYEVGDTVLIRVDRGPPGIGVIVELWERDEDDKEDDDDEGGGGSRPPPDADDTEDGPTNELGGEKYVRIKWFQRVKELPSMMANRLKAADVDHSAQIYYTSSKEAFYEFSDPLSISLVVSHCTISSDRPAPTELVKRGGTTMAKVVVTVEIEAAAGGFQHGKMTANAVYWCAGIADSKTGESWTFDNCLGASAKASKGGWTGFAEEALRQQEVKGRKAWIAGRMKEKPKPAPRPVAKPKAAATFRKARATSTAHTDVPSAHVDDADEIQVEEASDSDSDDDGSDAQPSSEEDEENSDEGEESASDEEEKEVSGASRKRKARAGPGGSPRKKRGKVGGKAATKAAARLKKAHDKKVQKTLKRLRAPKSKPMQDLMDQPLPVDPYQRALHLLHVGATPESLPCREEQYADVLVKIEGVIEGGGGGCIYISGQPGTGKTATVHAVVRELKQKARDMELPPFEYVEINGLKIPEPGHAYTVLWEALAGLSPDIELGSDDEEGAGKGTGRSVSAKAALKGLEAHFGTGSGRKNTKIGGARRTTYVVLMDELDQLFTAKQDVVYNFFNWPTLPNSQLIVIAVANTMDMPEKLAGRVKSRMGMERINFPPYSKDQLVEIAQSRLIAHPNPPPQAIIEDHQVIETDALNLAAAKTTGVTGDARRMLDVCRRAVEVAISSAVSSGISKDGSKPQPVKMRQISAVLAEMSRNPTAQFVRSCSLYEKVMLAAVVRGIRKTGVGELEWGRVKLDHSLILSSLTNLPPFRTRLLASEYSLVLASLLSSYALSVASITGNGGAANVVEDRRKIGLGSGMDESEVGRVLRDLQGEIGGEDKWRAMF